MALPPHPPLTSLPSLVSLSQSEVTRLMAEVDELKSTFGDREALAQQVRPRVQGFRTQHLRVTGFNRVQGLQGSALETWGSGSRGLRGSEWKMGLQVGG